MESRAGVREAWCSSAEGPLLGVLCCVNAAAEDDQGSGPGSSAGPGVLVGVRAGAGAIQEGGPGTCVAFCDAWWQGLSTFSVSSQILFPLFLSLHM